MALYMCGWSLLRIQTSGMSEGCKATTGGQNRYAVHSPLGSIVPPVPCPSYIQSVPDMSASDMG